MLVYVTCIQQRVEVLVVLTRHVEVVVEVLLLLLLLVHQVGLHLTVRSQHVVVRSAALG